MTNLPTQTSMLVSQKFHRISLLILNGVFPSHDISVTFFHFVRARSILPTKRSSEFSCAAEYDYLTVSDDLLALHLTLFFNKLNGRARQQNIRVQAFRIRHGHAERSEKQTGPKGSQTRTDSGL